MIIRNMKISDYEAVYKLWENTDGISLRTLDDSKEGTERFLNRNPETNFVCEINGKIVGVILCGHDGRKGFIYHVAVIKEHREKGIGKSLVDQVKRALINEGITKVAIVAYSNNPEGNRFWNNRSFIHLDDLNYRVAYLSENNELIS